MNAELSPEDALRLNVLLAGELHAVRIDESALTLHALTPRGDAHLALHPDCRPDQYLMRVRELLGGHALGSPGGYPVYLRRWTRMGHASPKNLEALLKLGEPEAITAVALAPGLTEELARRVWWALPTMEIGRYLLGHDAVRQGATGAQVAAFLIEHLPFEENPAAATDTIRAVVGAGLLDAAEREALWRKGMRRPHYLIGFLEYCPDDLPGDAARPLPPAAVEQAQAGNPWARQLVRCYRASGQSFLRGAELVLEKPPGHEAVYLALDILGRYFGPVRDAGGRECLAGLAAEADAMEALSRVSQIDAEPVLLRTTAVGPLMRRHLEPLLGPLIGHLRALRGAA
jgi:hypothetical protein